MKLQPRKEYFAFYEKAFTFSKGPTLPAKFPNACRESIQDHRECAAVTLLQFNSTSFLEFSTFIVELSGFIYVSNMATDGSLTLTTW